MTDNRVIVSAERVVKTFVAPDGRPLNAVDGLSLDIPKGQLTALVGPDGAGKTTLMRMMAGLMTPSQGELSVLGVNVVTHPQGVQDRISYMPQRFGLYDDLSVQENLELYADLHAVPLQERQQRFERLLHMTDMDRFTARPAGKLSGGMKQKLGLVCTLVRSPELLLLDEPSVGVDPLSRRDLWLILEQLVQDEDLNVIVSTAYMDEAERCARVLVMHHGQVLDSGTPQSLTQHADGLTYTATPPSHMLARELQAHLIDASDTIVDALPAGGNVRFIRQPGAAHHTLDTLLQNMQWQPRQATLEDAFMVLLKQHQQASSSESAPRSDAPSSAVPLNTVPSDHAPPRDVVIQVSDLVKTFGDFTAVSSTSFSVERGEIFGLLGPNGAGKTTTFRMLCGLLPATQGTLEVAGVNLRTARSKARKRIGYVAQKFSLYGNLTVRENLDFYAGVYGLRGPHKKARIDAILTAFTLEPNANSGQLPTGYKQRLAMAAGLLHQPDILFLDEPTSGIDPLARRSFWRTITQLSQQGVTIIVTTHFMEEAEYCDRIAIQDAGKMLALGSPQQVRQQAGHSGDMNSVFISIVEQGRQAAAAQKKGKEPAL